MDEQLEATLDEVLAEMDEVGRAKWEAAVARVENRKLREALAAARNGQQPGRGDEVPPAGEPEPADVESAAATS